MIYLYFPDGAPDMALMEFLRNQDRPCCDVVTPKSPTRASIDEHKRQSPYGSVLVVSGGVSRLVAEW